MRIMQEMSLMEKLNILSDAAKYDVACTSSGSNRRGDGKGIGNTVNAGICHSFSADGRCISLLKILFTNECIYDCKYCQNRRSNDVPRASFTPDEVCRLTIEFYRRNYIEGLFLSSGIIQNPNVTMGLLYQTIYKLRTQYHFQGYIHVKAIPGADPELIRLTGFLADRMSINLELPTAEGLSRLAPNKHRKTILTPMRQIQNGISVSKQEVALYRHAPEFVPAGQSTQMIIGATPEHDYEILSVAESLYRKFDLKRVFYSAFVKVNEDKDLPALQGGPPLLREHRLYQADWLLRFYGFEAGELLSEKNPDFNLFLDPKADWALRHLEQFPVEVNCASYEELLRVPGIGVKSARRIVQARRSSRLEYQHLKKIGVVLKRAIYFITCNGRQIIQTGASDLCLFTQYREVMPDAECAAKVARTLRRRFGEQAWEAISYALASEEADKSQAVYETVAAGLSGRIRGPLLQALAEPCIHRVFALSRSVHRVRERVLQFLRFQEITGGILYGEIAPDADVLALVMPHFADRFPLENFVILDERRAAAGIHPAGKAWFLAKLSKQELDTLQQAGQQKDENEQEIEVLFQSFCRSLSILERQNQPLQQQLVPLKYRMHMTEFQKK